MTEEDMATLRRVLHAMPADQLEAIGVKLLAPPEEDWEWVRAAMADALDNLGRTRAASALRHFPFVVAGSTYSVGISTDLLAEMGRIIRHRHTQPPEPA